MRLGRDYTRGYRRGRRRCSSRGSEIGEVKRWHVLKRGHGATASEGGEEKLVVRNSLLRRLAKPVYPAGESRGPQRLQRLSEPSRPHVHHGVPLLQRRVDVIGRLAAGRLVAKGARNEPDVAAEQGAA